MSVKSKHSSKKSKSGKKEQKKKIEDSDEDIESSEEELDLTKECHPIRHYLNDRAEMINQMFSVIKGKKLKAMLPPILKDIDLEQLKLHCLDQLLGMSEKRITCILEGENLETSSESEVLESDDFGDSDEKNGTTLGSSSDRSDDSQDERYANNVDNKSKKRKSNAISDERSGKVSKTESDNALPEQGRTLLEILELEMRARAIRALLKQSGNEKGSEIGGEESKSEEVNRSETQEVSGEVVDLTECEDEEFPTCVKKEVSEDMDIDEKVMSFEAKIEKSKTEKANSIQEGEKSKKLQAELELRNKLFKKKIYRTRQQRMENDEEEKIAEKNETESTKETVRDLNVVIKQEPIDPEPVEVTVEDPEEGEISTSEDEYPVEIKQEVIAPEEQQSLHDFDEFDKKIDEDAERITAIDNGTFVNNCNLENRLEVDTGGDENGDEALNVTEKSNEDSNKSLKNGAEESPSEPEPKTESEPQPESEPPPESESVPELENKEDESESSYKIEEKSWRDRWLQKDGVQKLVKSSKIFAKVKKRIAEKSHKAKEEVSDSNETGSDSSKHFNLEVVEGSIKEYEVLFGRQVKNDVRGNENSQEMTPKENETVGEEQQNLAKDLKGS